MLVAGALAIGLVGVAQFGLDDWALYNGSPSVPQGLYLRSQEPIARGSMVTVRSVEVAAEYAAERDFIDPGDRFIKRVAAVAGELVCASGSEVFVGPVRVERQSTDASGRALPAWSGCHVLGPDEVFLLGDTPDSFDSRYFGVVRTEQIEGVWRPL